MYILGRSTKILADDLCKNKSEEYLILFKVIEYIDNPMRRRPWPVEQYTDWGQISEIANNLRFYANDLPYTQVKSYYIDRFENKRKLSIIQEDIKEYLY